MLHITDINQSYSYIDTDIPDMYQYIMKKLTFSVKNHQFDPAFRAGSWDGNKRFYRIYNQKLIVPKGMVPQLLKQLEQYQPIYIPLQSHYFDIPSYIGFQQWVKSLNLPFNPYDYQIKSAYDSLCRKRQTNLLATSAGKSLVIYLIARWLYEHNIKLVMIFPSIMLVNQIKSDFTDYTNIKQLHKDLEKYKSCWEESLAVDDIKETENKIQQHKQFLDNIHLIGGEHKERSFDSPLTATTWQSVYDYPHMFKEIKAIIIDEVHQARASSFSESIMPSCEKAEIRLGFTGTLPPNVVDKIEVISSIGPKKTYITAQQLIERGLATPVTINCMFLEYDLYERNRINGLKYQDEIKKIYSHQGRLTFVKKLLTKLQNSGNTLVLFDRIELAEKIIMKLHEDKGPFFNVDDLRQVNEYNHMLITSKTKSTNRTQIVKHMEDNDNCLLFGTDSILSTGVSIKRLKNLVFLRAGTSPTRVIQAIGRILRMHPEIEKVNAYDLIDDCRTYSQGIANNNYCFTHWEHRLETYLEAGYPLKEINVKIMPEF